MSAWRALNANATTEGFAAAFAGIDVSGALAALAGTRAQQELLMALASTVRYAMYWQEPDNIDRQLANPAVFTRFRRLADALVTTSATKWFAAPMDPGGQWEVVFEDPEHRYRAEPEPDGRPVLTRARTRELERERCEPDVPVDRSSAQGGFWWSIPDPDLRRSTGTLDGYGPVGLRLAEDSPNVRAACCWPLAVRPRALVFEIDGPAAWTQLVGRYPLQVPKSRRHDWFRVTGRDGRWAIPDYEAVAEDFDAIHLTITGYLTTAGQAVDVGEWQSVLAGWDPDETYWLTDCAARVGDGERWHRTADREPFAWLPGAAPGRTE